MRERYNIVARLMGMRDTRRLYCDVRIQRRDEGANRRNSRLQ